MKHFLGILEDVKFDGGIHFINRVPICFAKEVQNYEYMYDCSRESASCRGGDGSERPAQRSLAAHVVDWGPRGLIWAHMLDDRLRRAGPAGRFGS